MRELANQKIWKLANGEVRAAQAKTLPKFEMKKRWVGGYQDDSEGNGDFQKEVKRVFDEKRL